VQPGTHLETLRRIRAVDKRSVTIFPRDLGSIGLGTHTQRSTLQIGRQRGYGARRQFITWPTLETPYGTGSWVMIDGLLHVRSAVGTKIAALGSLTPQSLARLLMWELANETECCG
jgi:hypothetical protein